MGQIRQKEGQQCFWHIVWHFDITSVQSNPLYKNYKPNPVSLKTLPCVYYETFHSSQQNAVKTKYLILMKK